MTVFTRKMHPVINDAEKEKQERIERVNKALQDFVNYYMPNKIYFDKELAKKLDDLSNEYRTKGWDFAQISKHLSDFNLTRESYDQYHKKLDNISDDIIKVFPKVIEELEDEFRTILGVK